MNCPICNAKLQSKSHRVYKCGVYKDEISSFYKSTMSTMNALSLKRLQYFVTSVIDIDSYYPDFWGGITILLKE